MAQAREEHLPAAGLYRLYLPVALNTDQFNLDSPIWAHTATPSGHEIAFFRHVFSCTQAANHASLKIFADTRYEVWLDGKWIGRGPARFSQSLREYDVYSLGAINNSFHTLAVLVQWAPNNRRSESVRPLLQAHIEAIAGSTHLICDRTSPSWQVSQSHAWRSDAALVHSWGLIGPTEILDLRLLPADWFMPGYDASTWRSAVVVSPTTMQNNLPQVYRLDSQSYSSSDFPLLHKNAIVPSEIAPIFYRPRSIPMLAQEPITATFIGGGRLSPGYRIGEISTSTPYTLTFSNISATPLNLEALSAPDGSSIAGIKLDGVVLAWQPVGSTRPDVYTAAVDLLPGAHELSFLAPGAVFALSSPWIEYQNFPFEQGYHAGHRMLLAELSPDELATHPLAEDAIQFTTLPAYALLDLGRTVHGRLQAVVSGPAGTVVDIGWDERLLEGTAKPLPYPGSLHPQWNQVDSWILDGSPRLLTTLDTRAGRYILIAVWGNGPVELRNIRVFEEHYPLAQTGVFTSTDKLLEQIWQMGVTTAYPNMTDAYTDTPWRERGQWWGDAYVTDQINRVAFGDTALLRRGLLYMAETYAPGFAPGAAPNNNGANMMDYTLLWVHSLYEYTQRTGDREVLTQAYPVLRQFLAQLAGYENKTTGLLDLPKANWWETVYVETLGFASRYGQSTAVNALYVSTLNKAAALAGLNGDSASQTTWQQKAVVVRQKINLLLFIPGENRYWTNIYLGEYYTPTVQAQAWALAYDIPENPALVADSLLELLSPEPQAPNIEAYGMFWVYKGLGQAGYIPQTIGIMKNYYPHMLNQDATTWWEGFNSNRSFTASLSHAWSGSPTWFLTTYLLGWRQTGPAEWELQPAYELLPSATGKMPLAGATVDLFWNHVGCGVEMVITAQPGTEGVVRLAPENLSSVLLNGQIWANHSQVESAQSSAQLLAIALTAGENRLWLEKQDCAIPARGGNP